jgi:ribose transport system ATP-binding protein
VALSDTVLGVPDGYENDYRMGQVLAYWFVAQSNGKGHALVEHAGLGVLYVTHHLSEVFRVADRVSVLRDGKLVTTGPIADFDHDSLVHALVGAAVEQPAKTAATEGPAVRPPAVLEIRNLRADTVRDVSLTIRPGEIVGIAGLDGSGREALLSAVYGAVPRAAGEVLVDGARLRAGRPDLSRDGRHRLTPPALRGRDR